MEHEDTDWFPGVPDDRAANHHHLDEVFNQLLPDGTPSDKELINQELEKPPTPRNLNDDLEGVGNTCTHAFEAPVDADGDLKQISDSFRGCECCSINSLHCWGGSKGIIAAGAWNFNVPPN